MPFGALLCSIIKKITTFVRKSPHLLHSNYLIMLSVHRLYKFLPVFISLLIFINLSSCVSAKKYKAMEYDKNVALADRINAQQRIDNLEGMIKRLKNDTTFLGNSFRNLSVQYSDLRASSTQTALQLSEQLNQNRIELRAYEKDLYEKETKLKEREHLVQELQMAIDRKEAAQRTLIEHLRTALIGFSSEDLQIIRKDGKVYVSMSEKLLFKSGQAEVDEIGKFALSKLADVMNRNPEIDIIVEGHTDNVPIKTAIYKDNWDLSVYRATTVTRILSEQYGVNATRILASGRGEFFPVASNEDSDGKSKNRRTEIILMPKLDEIYRTLDNSATPIPENPVNPVFPEGNDGNNPENLPIQDTPNNEQPGGNTPE